MALPPGFIDTLRERVPLSRVVERKVSWDPRKTQAAKGDYWAPCPFHQEKTASFHVDDGKGFYHCFGCQAGGDVIDFLRETESIGFMEAVELLAREAGVPMPARDPAATERAAATDSLTEAVEAAVQFYRLQLATARAADARAYLDRRGLTAATRERFEIGVAPDARTTLLDHLTGRGFSREQLAEAGLVGVPRDGGSPYDRFRGRIMFPIRDPRGKAIGFGARALKPNQEPKYLNSPETPLFDKGRTLFNSGNARSAAAKAGTVIVVEGYMDAIALVQAGIDHVVAPLGTAITEAQLGLLWKLAAEPVVALDGDRAGLAAGQRLVDLALPLLEPGRSLRFALLPEGADPDDLVRGGGARAMTDLLDRSRPIIDLLWTRETGAAVLDSPDRRAALMQRLHAHAARIRDQDLRDSYLAEFRSRARALSAPRRPESSGRGKPSAGVPSAPSPATRGSRLAKAPAGPAAEARGREGVILYGCLSHPEVAAAREQALERLDFCCADLGKIRDALLSALDDSLHAESPGVDDARDSLLARVTTSLGADPLSVLMSIGHVRVSRHFGPGADRKVTARAVDEELARHAALAGASAEVRDAEVELASGFADDAVDWHLRHAVDRANDAWKLAETEETYAQAEAVKSAFLQEQLDREIWRKSRNR